MKIHCSLVDPRLPPACTNPPGPLPCYSPQQESAPHSARAEAANIKMEEEAVSLTRLECAAPHEDTGPGQEEGCWRALLGHTAEAAPEFSQLPSSEAAAGLSSSCQMSPVSDSLSSSGSGSCSLHFSLYQTPPSSDLDDYPAPAPPPYYPLLSPPLSSSDPCLSPGDSMSPPHCPAPCPAPGTKSEKCEAIKHSEQSSDHNQETSNNQHNLHNQPEDDAAPVLSSSHCSNQKNEEEACTNCSPAPCASTLHQSKLKQLFNAIPQQLSCYDSKQSISSFHLEGNFMKLMENSCGKNIKQSMKEETKELISTATDGGDTCHVTPTSKGQPSACPLPADIPTLESLSKSSPKLSTWRQTRIISEKLEQHLWTWRCACKKSGKRISKSLLQARAKWAFRKAGIVEFKVSVGKPLCCLECDVGADM